MESAGILGPGAELPGFLRGRWRLARTLEDFAAGIAGRFTGTAVFSDAPDGSLRHLETGTLYWAGMPPAQTQRELLWRPGPGPAFMHVFFADGRFFHDVNFVNGSDNPEHLCPPDTYRGSFELESPNAWRYEWLVTGPRKDLRLFTRLTRYTTLLKS